MVRPAVRIRGRASTSTLTVRFAKNASNMKNVPSERCSDTLCVVRNKGIISLEAYLKSRLFAKSLQNLPEYYSMNPDGVQTVCAKRVMCTKTDDPSGKLCAMRQAVDGAPAFVYNGRDNAHRAKHRHGRKFTAGHSCPVRCRHGGHERDKEKNRRFGRRHLGHGAGTDAVCQRQ